MAEIRYHGLAVLFEAAAHMSIAPPDDVWFVSGWPEQVVALAGGVQKPTFGSMFRAWTSLVPITSRPRTDRSVVVHLMLFSSAADHSHFLEGRLAMLGGGFLPEVKSRVFR